MVVAGICVERDAISAAAAAQSELFAELPEVDDVTLMSQYSNRDAGVRQVVVTDPWELIRDPHVADADLVVYHWGIRYQLFDSLSIVGQERPTAVYFQNLTPAAMVGRESEAVVHESVLQIQLPMLTGTPIWAPSQFNYNTLVEWGYAEEQLRIVPFPVDRPAHLPRYERGDRPQLLSVGRLVPSKGLHVLVESMATVVDRVGRDLSLDLVGSTDLSDSGYLDRLRYDVTSFGLDDVVRFRLNVSDEELWELYDRAHVVISPSFHEGFCVPIVEAYLAGCRVVATDAGNLPFLVQPPDPIVPAGDAAALAEAIVSVLPTPDEPLSVPASVGRLVDTYSKSSVVESLRQALIDGVAGGPRRRRSEAVELHQQRHS